MIFDMSLRFIVSFVLGCICIAGISTIVYYGRPVIALRAAYRETSKNNQEFSLSQGTFAKKKQNIPSVSISEGTGTMKFSMKEVNNHSVEEDCWTIIDGSVYDLTSFISRHPGGPNMILRLCGTDGSEKFNEQHGRSYKAQQALGLLLIGKLE